MRRTPSSTFILKRDSIIKRVNANISDLSHPVLLSIISIFLVAMIGFFRQPAVAVRVDDAPKPLDIRPAFADQSQEVKAQAQNALRNRRLDIPTALQSIVAPRTPLAVTRFGITIPLSIHQRSLCTSNDFGTIYQNLVDAKVSDVLLTIERFGVKTDRVILANRISTANLLSYVTVEQIPEELADGRLAGVFLCTDPGHTGSCLDKRSLASAADSRALRQGGLLYFSPVRLSRKGLVVPSLTNEYMAAESMPAGQGAGKGSITAAALAAAKEIDRRQESLALRYARGVFSIDLPVAAQNCAE